MDINSKRLCAFAISLVLAVVGAAVVPSAEAAFPGRNGKIVFVRSPDLGSTGQWMGDIWVMDPDGRHQTRLTFTGLARSPQWSADGTKIAYAQLTTANGTSDIWVMNADGTRKHRVTTHAASESKPTWSPDGTWLAFASDRSGIGEPYTLGEIYKIRSTRPYGRPVRLTFTDPLTGEGDWITNASPAWSPDGSRIAFSVIIGNSIWYGGSLLSLGLMKADGSRLHVDTMYTEDGTLLNAGEPSWGPGGAYLAWSHEAEYYEDPATNVYRSAPGSAYGTEVTHYDAWQAEWVSGPAWSPNHGRHIVYSAFVSGAPYEPAIYRVASNGSGAPILIARNGSDPDWGVRPAST